MKPLPFLLTSLSAVALALANPVAAQVSVNPDALGPARPVQKPKPKPKSPVAAKPAPAKAAPARAKAKPPAPKAAPVLAPVEPTPAPISATPIGPERDRADLRRISDHLNSIRTLRAAFIQSGPNGENDQGLVYVNRPGRMRFEYAKPSPYLIVADGVSVAVGNSELKTVDRYPLIDNPLSMILDDSIDLNKNGAISKIERRPGEIIVTAKREDGSMKGQVTLYFAEPDLTLKRWVVTDAQGLDTMVTLQSAELGVTLNPELFILRDVNKFADPRE